jgi:hypothetical protein
MGGEVALVAIIHADGILGGKNVSVETKGAAPDPFVQPTGAADAYSVGDRVTFEGAVWESVIDANTWSPAAYPAGWKKV